MLCLLTINYSIMKNIFQIFILLTFTVHSISLLAQQPTLPAKNVVVYMELPENALVPSIEDMMNNPDVLNNQTYKSKVIVHLFDEVDIAKIHIKLGTTPSSADLAEHSFNFDESIPNTPPFTYQRDGLTVALGLGEFSNLETYHVEVVMEDIHGGFSEPKYFSSN